MLTGKYVSIDHVVERVYMLGLPPQEIDKSEVAEWVYEAMSFIGVPNAYELIVTNGEGDNPDPVVIDDHRGELPCNVYQVNSVREYNNKIAMTEAVGNFKPGYNTDNSTSDPYAYYLNDNYIFTGFGEGKVEMSFLGMPTDQYGLPKIPDNVAYIRSVTLYAAVQIARRLYIQDKLSERKFEKINQDYLWSVGSAKGRARMPSLDKSEAIKNMLARTLQVSNHHEYNFKYLGYPERLKIHP